MMKLKEKNNGNKKYFEYQKNNKKLLQFMVFLLTIYNERLILLGFFFFNFNYDQIFGEGVPCFSSRIPNNFFFV
jgi:hypothetical protein